jgi:hypothetical protein
LSRRSGLAHISSSFDSRTIGFDPIDFLTEAIEEFLESGAKPKRIASCVIKIATATELLLKEKLENICPALVLDGIDEYGLQVAKLYGLSKKMISPKELDNVEIRTASFPKLLNRSAKFFDLRDIRAHLTKLHGIRNNLIHHRGEVNLAEVNLLLIDKIFPFCERFTKDDKYLHFRLKPTIWKQLGKLAESSRDEFVSDLAKKLAHYGTRAEKVSAIRIKFLLTAPVELEGTETLNQEGLRCPACRNQSLAAVDGFDVEYEEGGPFASPYHFMLCKVCGLSLDQSEVEQIIFEFERFFGEDQDAEKESWEEVIQEPEFPNEYL